jgi:hypothetical protein
MGLIGGIRGSLLLWLIFALTAASAVGATAVSLSRGTAMTGLYKSSNISAGYIAESGARYALPLVQSDLNSGITTNMDNLNGKTFTVSGRSFIIGVDKSKIAQGIVTMTSTGVINPDSSFESKRGVAYVLTKPTGGGTTTFTDNFSTYKNINDLSKVWNIHGRKPILINSYCPVGHWGQGWWGKKWKWNGHGWDQGDQHDDHDDHADDDDHAGQVDSSCIQDDWGKGWGSAWSQGDVSNAPSIMLRPGDGTGEDEGDKREFAGLLTLDWKDSYYTYTGSTLNYTAQLKVNVDNSDNTKNIAYGNGLVFRVHTLGGNDYYLGATFYRSGATCKSGGHGDHWWWGNCSFNYDRNNKHQWDNPVWIQDTNWYNASSLTRNNMYMIVWKYDSSLTPPYQLLYYADLSNVKDASGKSVVVDTSEYLIDWSTLMVDIQEGAGSNSVSVYVASPTYYPKGTINWTSSNFTAVTGWTAAVYASDGTWTPASATTTQPLVITDANYLPASYFRNSNPTPPDEVGIIGLFDARQAAQYDTDFALKSGAQSTLVSQMYLL